MKNREVIEDSLNFCKDIKYYESEDKNFLFDSKNYPNLKEYIKWMDHTDSSIAKDYENFEQALNLSEHTPSSTYTSTSNMEEVIDLSGHTPVKMLEEPVITAPSSTFKSILSFFIELVICIAISIGLVFLVSTFLVTHTRVIGHSMEDTLHDGEYLFINRLTYEFSDPKQFDIIVFQHTDDEKYIKRVIACPGQTIQIIDGIIYVDGKVLNENYGNETMTNAGIAADPITLGDDEYFVLGDNRNNSSDSRTEEVGLIKRDKIQGKVLFRFYPFNRLGTVE